MTLICGEDISKVDPEELLKRYSIVFQDVNLFDNTILENIRIGKKGATDEEVLKAAKEANCDEFVQKLPNGYNTVIGGNGCNLSGGERQRLSIARALLTVDADYRPVLKSNGFLTRDPRMKERKKYGLKAARRAPQFSKR